MKSLLEYNKYVTIKDKMILHEFHESLLGFEQLCESEESEEVLNLIKSGEFDSDAYSFKQSLGKSKHSEMLTDYSVQELKKLKLFKVPGFNIGFALKKKDGKFQEIVAVHNNEPQIKGIGKDLIKAAIKEGGIYLDHFDGFLTGFYKSLGFVEYARDKFDPQYDEGGHFEAKYGKQDIIYRKLQN
jgi:hypothetical protein